MRHLSWSTEWRAALMLYKQEQQPRKSPDTEVHGFSRSTSASHWNKRGACGNSNLPSSPSLSVNSFHNLVQPEEHCWTFTSFCPRIRHRLEPTWGEGNGTPLQYSCLENPMDGGAWWAAVHGVAKSQTPLSNSTFIFHFHALEKEMAINSSVLAWRIPGMGEPGGLPSMGLHRVGHDWSNLAAAVLWPLLSFPSLLTYWVQHFHNIIF